MISLIMDKITSVTRASRSLRLFGLRCLERLPSICPRPLSFLLKQVLSLLNKTNIFTKQCSSFFVAFLLPYTPDPTDPGATMVCSIYLTRDADNVALNSSPISDYFLMPYSDLQRAHNWQEASDGR